jgi:hypothetical protein
VSRHRPWSRRTRDSERTLGSWLPYRVLTCRPGRITDLLSWDSSRRTDLRTHDSRRGLDLLDLAANSIRRSSGVVTPLHRHPFRASTPPIAIADDRFGPGATCLGILFRPRGFAPPRRLPPLGRSRACCIPLPVMGFVAFPALGFPTASRQVPKDRVLSAGVPMHSPRRCSHPSKNSTRPQPHHVTVAVAPLPFAADRRDPSRRLRCRRHRSEPSDRSVGFEALLRRRVRDALQPLPAGGRPILPGLCSPSRSFPETRGHPRPLDSPCIHRDISEDHTMLQELRSSPAGLAPRRPHRRAPCGDRRWG